MQPANDDGNSLPSPPHASSYVDYVSEHHVAAEESRGGSVLTKGGFHRVDNSDDGGYVCVDACEGARIGGAETQEEDVALSLNELMYSAHSFHVISLPGK